MALVRAHENATGVKYDVLYKGRPDVAWLRPLRLHALASMLAPTTLLTSNDVNEHLPHWLPWV